MKSFDEWMSEDYSGSFDMPHQRDAYEAGAQSRQAEVDKLQAEIDEFKGRIKYLESVKNGYRGEATEFQEQINELQAMYEKQGLYAFELQKRIDEALRELMVYKNIQTAITALKGNQNE